MLSFCTKPAPTFTCAADTSLTNCCEQTLVLLFVPCCLKHCMVAAPISCAWTFHMPCRGNSPTQCIAISPYSTSTYFYRYCWHKFNKLLWTNILLFVPQLFHILYSTPYSAGTYLYMCCWHKFDKLCWANSDPVVCSTVVSNTTQLHTRPAYAGLTICCEQSLIQLFIAQLFHTLYGGSSPVLCMDISSDSTIIATGAADKNVKLWGLDFGDLKKSLFAHDDRWVRTCILFFFFLTFPQDAFVFSSVEIES